VLRADAKSFLTDGTPEAQVFAAVPPGAEGVTLAALKAVLPGDLADLGFRQAMQQRRVLLGCFWGFGRQPQAG